MKTVKWYGALVIALVTIAILWSIHSELPMLGFIVIGIGSAFVVVGWMRFAAPLLAGMYSGAMGIARHTMDEREQSHRQRMEIEDQGLKRIVVQYAVTRGMELEMSTGGTIHARQPRRDVRVFEEREEPLQIEAPKNIPDFVSYDSIRFQIPDQHILIGVGEGGALDTREKEVKGLTWIVGSSGAGKSNTTAIRVDEDYERGHKFLGIDPHFFKDDSLSNSVAGYMDQFIEPMAYKDEDILRVLNFFISEVERRKQGAKCWPLTLLIDEIGSLTADKPTDKQEEEIINKIKKCARLAGQETRGFNMNLIAISQDAAGLAWLRKRALLVIGHKVTMMSERQLVCNERGDIAREMDTWPVGRTVVYGVALQGVFRRQQPLFVPRQVRNVPRNEVRNTGTLYNSPTVPMLLADAQERLPGTPPYGMRVVSLEKKNFSPERTEATPEEREQILELARAGTPRRDICRGLGKGKWFYETVKQVLDEEGL